MQIPQDILLPFYLSRGMDSRGRTIDEILKWDDKRLEGVHDYIQWLFPLPEKSAFNPEAPLLEPKIVEEFRTNPELQKKIQKAFLMMLRFYGFSQKGSEIVPTKAFDRKAQNWLTPRNHNFLRITRILRCLALIGMAEEAAAFVAALEQVYATKTEVIGTTTLRFWREAVLS
jgi:hypothetical protein